MYLWSICTWISLLFFYLYEPMNITKVASFFISAFGIVATLIYGKDFLMPFIFAFLIWFLVREIKALMNKVEFVNNKFPNWLKNLISSIIIFWVLFAVESILESSIRSIAKSYSLYQTNMVLIAMKINNIFNIDVYSLIKDYSMDFDFANILGSILSSLTDLLGDTFLIVFYCLFIFIEEGNFKQKLSVIFKDAKQHRRVTETLRQLEISIGKYLGLKTLVSIMTGVLSYIVLYFVGIDSPMFWAFLIFLLNYIPAIGSLVATIFPAVFSLIQFAEFAPFVLILVFVGAIQAVIGNIVEPKLFGNSLNLSPLVAILSLSFWGYLWGILGMFLSVPIMVILVIVLSKFPKTRPIAKLLSEKGHV